ncbi:hypothetical protein OH76DRAFT_1473148 [Lentinus brumalis]|uniref:Uncharacterized protein n=1 Tax=Lentinus brumalis TaxID=2498619 RepID=A0A371D332_9APHY|nr:hypothetical protein OH76DRAFT_1473148 [Polyporus brumalis]
MSVCTGAHTTCSDEPIPRDSNSDIIAGDVYSIQESIYAAVFDILRSSDIADRRLYAQCRVAAIRLQTREKATKKIRPCIAMNSHATTRRKADDNAVCLTTSWEKTPLTALPALFRFFSFPILRDCCDNSEHCHSLPAWGIDNAFVFAWEFKSERPFINRWPERQKGDPPEHPCTFGQNALEKIRNVCKAKKAEWAAKCKEDPEYAAWNARACLKHMKTREKELAKAEKAAAGASLHSGRTGYTVDSANTARTGASAASGHTYQSFRSIETNRSGGGADRTNWRDRSEQYPSLATVTKALHDPDGFILSESKPRKPRERDVDLFSVISAASSKFKPWKTPGKDTDKSSVISIASNKYAMLANLRRGSRDH